MVNLNGKYGKFKSGGKVLLEEKLPDGSDSLVTVPKQYLKRAVGVGQGTWEASKRKDKADREARDRHMFWNLETHGAGECHREPVATRGTPSLKEEMPEPLGDAIR